MKFKNYIETESGIKDTSTSPGTAGQVLSSTITGTSWIDPDTLVSAASKLVVIACKNVSGVPILKGTPVYQSGTVGATDVIEVEPANAIISTGYLPAIGILQTTLNNNGFGNVVITGEFLNYSTSDIPSNNPGGVPITGDTVYLAAGGGLTCIKPTGAGNAIQNLGLIGKVSGGNAGSITVSSIMRANDVPNLPTGRIWIGDGNTIVSDTVYVDEPNGRVGIGTTSPSELLHISSTGPARLLIEADTDNVTETDNAQIILKQDGGAVVGSLGYKTGTNTLEITNGYAATDGILTLGTSGAERMRIDYLGRVGIGTTVLTSISSSSSTLSLGSTSATTSGGIAFQVSGGIVKAYNYVASNYLINQTVSGIGQIFYGAGSERMRIHNTTGNVGINTTSPSQKLHVVGSGYFQNGNVFVGTTSNNMFNYISTFVILAGSGQTIALGGGPGNVNNNVLIGNGNLSVSGNVGIGTTNPLAKLQVDGNANIGLLHTNFAGASFNVNLGFENYNNGFAAIATGQNTLADASQSFSMGFQSKATGVASLAGGNVNPSTALPSESAGEASIAFGNGVKTNSNANYSQAFGRGTQTGGGLTSANQAMAMGFSSIAFGDNSFSGGNNSRAFGEASFAFGEGAVGSKGDGNIALGIGVTTPNDGINAYSSGQVAVGNYNVWGTGGQPLSFSVGNGFSASQRLTALCVHRNTGNTGMGNVLNPQSKLQVNGGIQLANDVAAPSAAKVGTFKYYTSGNNSYVDMCMQTGASTYAWVNIVTNSW